VQDCRHDLGSARFGSFSAWGVTGISFGILLVCRWSRWYALVLLVFAETQQNGRMQPGVSEEVRGLESILRTDASDTRWPENIFDARHLAA
jgi:hypothetical protein